MLPELRVWCLAVMGHCCPRVGPHVPTTASLCPCSVLSCANKELPYPHRAAEGLRDPCCAMEDPKGPCCGGSWGFLLCHEGSCLSLLHGAVSQEAQDGFDRAVGDGAVAE